MHKKIRDISSKKLTCIIPAFNEHDNLELSISRVEKKLASFSKNYEIIIVDDGSTDGTHAYLREVTSTSLHIKSIHFSRNFGKEYALSAGIDYATGDVCFIIDADLQNPIDLFDRFVEEWSFGLDMVYGYKSSRPDEGWLKVFLTKIYYLIFKAYNPKIHINAQDFRLMDKVVIKQLQLFREKSRFMKGLFSWVGFNVKGIPFQMEPRLHGKTKFNFKRLLKLALDGLFSFSPNVLSSVSVLGLLVAFLSFTWGWVLFIERIFFGVDVAGFATLAVGMFFLGGVQLFSLGVIGEYISRIFNETKNRPLYIISEKYNLNDL